MTENTQTTLTADELRFVQALRESDEAAMIAVFTKVAGTANLDAPKATTAPANKPAPAEIAAPLPPSHVARERSRARQLAPDMRFRMLGILEELQTLVSDTAFRIMSERPHYKQSGLFENDSVATLLLHGVIDYLTNYPDINQVSSEYHVYPHFDIEWDYSRKTLKALDPAGKVQAVESYADALDAE